MKAARAEASAQRKAEEAARQRQIELRCEVRRLALAAVKAGIQAKGQRKLSTYSRAELTMMANALIAPWFRTPHQSRASVERNSRTEWSCEVIKGYARVSTDGQDLATQHELLQAAGAELVFSEKQSGIKTDRAALARCMRSLEPGDTVVVTKLDRQARSMR